MRAKDSPKIKDNYTWICSTPTSLVRSAALQEVRKKGAVSMVDLVFTFKDSFLKALCVPCYSERARSGMQKPVPPEHKVPCLPSEPSLAAFDLSQAQRLYCV